MADTIQIQLERDILPWILSIKRTTHWAVQPALRAYRILDFFAQVALVLGGIGISYPALNLVAATTGKPPPVQTAPANGSPTPATVPAGEDGSTKPANQRDKDGLAWVADFAQGKHAGWAVVLVLVWAGSRVYFQQEKMAERSVLVGSLQTEGRKLEKAVRDSLVDPTRTAAELVALQANVKNLIDVHIEARSYPDTAPLEGTDEEAKTQVAALKNKFPDAPWTTELANTRR